MVSFVSPTCRRSEHSRCEWSGDVVAAARAMMLAWPCECACHKQPDWRTIEPYASDPDGPDGSDGT